MSFDLTVVGSWITEITAFLTDIGMGAPVTVVAVIGLAGYAARHVVRVTKKAS
jgi:uncharacterized membrane protein (Fun14 family)